MIKTGYFTHPDCRAHEMGADHPECPARLDAIDDRLLVTGVRDVLAQREAPAASAQQIQRAHNPQHVQRVEQLCAEMSKHVADGLTAYVRVDPDTLMNHRTWDAARRAAGAAIAATDAVIAGELENAFCAVRPPGHHACRDKAMGFCFFGNIAIAALHALEQHGLQRVAVVDFDVHHGNGTEDVLAGDERVLMVSFFQHPFYPYTGDATHASNMLNLPVPAFTQGSTIRELIDAHWMPRLEAFKPEMIFISAGFDAHRDDDLGQLGLNEADYAWITQRIKSVARKYSNGRIVSSLEGGYNLDALARSVEAHVRVLADI